ncbi:MAG: hypothetical protein K8R35_07855, partial [Bacteroidales bacterium]|nr:hypothetical protein [Bacteroidales bacterium]
PELRDLRQEKEELANSTLHDVFNALLDKISISVDVIAGEKQKADDGTDILVFLKQSNLTIAQFNRLYQLTTFDSLLDSEWEEMFSIIVQSIKVSFFHEWIGQERERNIIVNPDFFQIPEEEVEVNDSAQAWRYDYKIYRSWRNTLKSRIKQEESLEAGIWDAVEKTEEEIFPNLRDELIGELKKEEVGLNDRKEGFEQRYVINAQTDGSKKTTRIQQAIETLQGIIWRTRIGEDVFYQLILNLKAQNFDEEWKWMGSYSAWRAAMFVFLYPENILQPDLKRKMTPAFEELIDELNNIRRLNPKQVRDIASKYEQYFHQVCQLTPEACVLADNNGLSILYVFACSYNEEGFKEVYVNNYDINNEHLNINNYWNRIPGVVGVTDIVGATVYSASPDEKIIYIFYNALVNGGKQLLFTTFNLNKQKWSSEINALSLDLPVEVTNYKSMLVQSSENFPPRIVIQVYNVRSKPVYQRGMNAEGNDWSTIDWLLMYETETEPPKYLNDVINIEPDGYIVVIAHEGAHPFTDLFFRNFYGSENEWHELGRGRLLSACGIPGGGGALRGFAYISWKRGEEVFSRFISQYDVPPFEPAKLPSDFGYGQYEGIMPAQIDRNNIFEKSIVFYNRSDSYGWSYCSFNMVNIERPLSSATKIVPLLNKHISISDKMSEINLKERRSAIYDVFLSNMTATLNIMTYIEEVGFSVPCLIALKLRDNKQYISSMDWFRNIYNYNGKHTEDRYIYYGLELGEEKEEEHERVDDWLLEPLDSYEIANNRKFAYIRYTLQSISRCLIDYADMEFTQDTSGSRPRAKELYETALDLLGLPAMSQEDEFKINLFEYSFDIPVNILPRMLRLHAKLNLWKLNNGRNIAGMEREEIPLYSVSVDDTTGMPTLTGGQINVSHAFDPPATSFRYEYLIERAKQFADRAAQMEAAFLSAIEKKDAEYYNLMKARQDLQLSKASVRLQDLRVLEAEDGIKLATLQVNRSEIM